MAAEDVVRKWQDAANRGDVTGIASLYAPDAVLHHVLSLQPLRGREAIRQFESPMFKAFSNIQWKASNVMAKGNTVAAEFEVGATNTGPIQMPTGTIPATNRRVHLRGASFIQLNEQGQIVEERRYFDTASFMAQLGLMPGR